MSSLFYLHFRENTKEFFHELNQANIPILVFSAGLGDTVEAVLKHCEVLLPNVEVSVFFNYFEINTNETDNKYVESN